MSEIRALVMPKWGLSMTEGKVARWLVEEGAEVTAGDELVEIETDKILSSLEAPVSGVLRRKIAKESDEVPVAGLLAVIAGAAVPDSQIDVFVADFGRPPIGGVDAFMRGECAQRQHHFIERPFEIDCGGSRGKQRRIGVFQRLVARSAMIPCWSASSLVFPSVKAV